MNGLQSGNGDSAHGLFSPEGVRLELPITGPTPRMLAYGIDLLIIVLLVIILLVTLPIGSLINKWFVTLFHRVSVQPAKPNGEVHVQGGGIVIAVFLLAQFAIETGYFILWEMLTVGRSPGKIAVGLRVVQRNGLPIELGNTMVRNLLRIVDLLPAYYVVGLISMLLSPGGERLGDHAAGTIVIRLDRPQTAPEIPLAMHPEALSLTREQLARIGPRETRLIRATLRRLAMIPENRREPLLAEVAEALRQRLELSELPRPDRMEFLRNLLALAERYARDN